MMMRNACFAFVCSLVATTTSAQTVPGRQALENGVRACQKTVEEVAKFVLKENKHASLAAWNKANPDARLFNAQVGVSYGDGKSVAILNVAPTRTGKCDSVYTTIFTTETPCAVARETTFKDWKFGGELGGMLVLENKDGSLSKILLPMQSGCVMVTTEVTYE